MQTTIIILMLLTVLVPFGAIAFLFRTTTVNKSNRRTKKITAVENDEIFNHLFIPAENRRNKKFKIIKS